MQTMEAPSTDKRLDDLNVRMTEGFSRLDGDVRELRGDIKDLRGEMNKRFAGVDARFESVDARFDAVDARFDAMHRTMMRGFFALGGVMVTLFLALAGLQGF
jgi:hypothetical protein